MIYIYALKLEKGKYYIGKTSNPQFRLQSHFNSNGSYWTKKYKPVKVIEIKPNCDDYDEEEEWGKNDSDEYKSEHHGVQQKYVEAIQKEVQKQVKEDYEGKKWLLDLLNENNWWIRKVHAHIIIKKLKLTEDYGAYYRDVYFWLPEVRWRTVEKIYRPSCPTCKCNTHVGAHGFRDNHFGRVVVGLKETYYIISRRYICHQCKRIATQAKGDVEKFAKEKGLNVEVGDAEFNYTFMGWDKRILPLFAHGRGEEFPAYLTWKAGVDKTIIDLMRPLYDGGLRPERFSDMLVELHSKEFTQQCIRHEYDI